MLKVGITGQAGFIGTHLFNYLNLKKDKIATIPFHDNYFESQDKLKLLPERFLAVAPGGGDSWGKDASYKRWPVKYFAELIARLQKEKNLPFFSYSPPF